MSNLELIKAAIQEKKALFLTTDAVENLTGKEIITYTGGYIEQYVCRRFVVGEVISCWDLAARDTNVEGFENRQQYWASYMSKNQINNEKKKFTILDSEGQKTHINTDQFSDGSFWSGDSDRYVSYIICEDHE